ncbi:MAG: RNA polymerase sigma-70 factor [Cytophagales bacterium]|nr:RNA polymerase sigma-70 factor [Cytophagales bacterium]
MKNSLIKQLVRGNQKAFRKIFDLYKDRLYYYALKITKDSDASEDIVQQVFVSLWNHRAEVSVNYSFDAYLFRIVRNCAFNYLKSSAKAKLLKQRYLDQCPWPPLEVVGEIAYHECEEVALLAIDALPEKRQIIFKMSYEDGMSHEDIAKMLDISVHTVKSQLLKATKKIKQQLLL